MSIAQSTTFTANERTGSGSFFDTLKDSAVNIGTTVLLGGTAGAGGGKIASLIPYTPTKTALNFQYADMFEKAVKSETMPQYLENAEKTVTGAVESGRGFCKQIKEAICRCNEAGKLHSAISNASEEIFNGVELQNSLKQFLKKSGIEVTEEALTKKSALSALEKAVEKHAESMGAAKTSFDELKSGFVEQIKEDGTERIKEIADKGAKHFRKTSIIGTGIAIGVMGALVLNLLRTYGVIRRKNYTAQPPEQIPQHQRI